MALGLKECNAYFFLFFRELIMPAYLSYEVIYRLHTKTQSHNRVFSLSSIVVSRE